MCIVYSVQEYRCCCRCRSKLLVFMLHERYITFFYAAIYVNEALQTHAHVHHDDRQHSAASKRTIYGMESAFHNMGTNGGIDVMRAVRAYIQSHIFLDGVSSPSRAYIEYVGKNQTFDV